MKRSQWLVVLVGVCSFAAGFSLGSALGQQGPPTEKFKASGQHANFEWFFLVIDAAKAQGIWSKNGLDPEFVPAAASAVQLKEQVGSGIKIGWVNTAEVLLARSQGVPVKIVAGHFRETIAKIFVKADGPIKAPGTPPNDRVIDTRVGFDHVAFHVSDRGELDKVVEMLRSAGVPTAGIERDPTRDKDYVCFRDPDNVQWEFYHMSTEATSAQRRAQLRAVADRYFEALSRKDFELIPYDEKVTLRAPLAPGGVNQPLVGREALRTVWWPPLVPAVGRVTILDHYINDSLTAICSEALVEVVAVKPPATLRVADRFTVNREGKIIEQENHFDPRDVTNPGWQTA